MFQTSLWLYKWLVYKLTSKFIKKSYVKSKNFILDLDLIAL